MNLDPELATYIRNAWQQNEDGYRQRQRGGAFRTPMFEFVRKIKAHPALENMDGTLAAETVEKYLAAWESAANNPWTAAFPNSGDPLIEFMDTWQKVKWPRGELDRALEAAKLHPLNPRGKHSPNYALFVSFAGYLQRNRQGPILLPCHKIAEVLSGDAMSISRYRKRAVTDGILRTSRKGRRQQRLADEFYFEVGKFDWTTGEQIDSENLNICVTPEATCYTDIQETKRDKGNKEINEIKDESGEERNKRAIFHKREFESELIPTTAKLAEELEKTKGIRTAISEFD